MSDRLERALAAQIGSDRLVPPSARPPDALEDVCRRHLGTPRAWVRPRDGVEVAAVIALARAERVPVVPVGLRTAYWSPLSFEGAIVIEVQDLDGIDAPDLANRVLWCGAGASVRSVDDALRRAGLALPAHPDASGDTSIGSMVATGFTSGVGMGMADADDVVAGLEVVLGTGARVITGAAASLGAAPFVRGGLPDPTGLLLASEGALGLITRVAVRPRSRAHRSQLSTRLPPGKPGLLAALALAESLRIPGLYETFRAIDPGEPGASRPIDVDIVVQSPLSAAELDARARFAAARLAERAIAPIDRIDEAPAEHVLRRFSGEPGDAWSRTRRARFAPVDVNVGYDFAARVVDASDAVLDEARRLSAVNLRRALYFAPDFVNVGLHLSIDLARTTDADARALIARGAAAISEVPVVPYRWGRTWGEALGGRVDPGYRALMLELKRAFDPDGILQPGVSIFGAAAPS